FSIQSFKKHHRFNPSKTFRERSKFLGQCSTADPAHVSKIMSKIRQVLITFSALLLNKPMVLI
ncbi:hypothetical protein MJO11_15210, partial [Salmonella enterica subsp. enterica serovar Anatum]|nr:hypothetical protein [Salmonella enterica subsp. enterica serovar Anatum]